MIVGYFEDGPNLVTMAMNGWGDGGPAWWLNLQARPDAEVRLAGGAWLVRARALRDLAVDRSLTNRTAGFPAPAPDLGPGGLGFRLLALRRPAG